VRLRNYTGKNKPLAELANGKLSLKTIFGLDSFCPSEHEIIFADE
jgi:hypothetical protein